MARRRRIAVGIAATIAVTAIIGAWEIIGAGRGTIPLKIVNRSGGALNGLRFEAGPSRGRFERIEPDGQVVVPVRLMKDLAVLIRCNRPGGGALAGSSTESFRPSNEDYDVMGVNAIIYEDYVSFIYELKRREEDTSFWARLWRRFQVVPAKRPARRR